MELMRNWTIAIGYVLFIYIGLTTVGYAVTPQELQRIRRNLDYGTQVPVIPTEPYSAMLGFGRYSGAYLIDHQRIHIAKDLNPFVAQMNIAHELGHFLFYEKLSWRQKQWFCRNSIKASNATWYTSATSDTPQACSERFAEMYMLRTVGEWSFLPTTPIFDLLNNL